MFFALTKYDPSLVKERSADKKYYCIDTGLRNILLNPQSEDLGKLLENAVYLHLRRTLAVQGELHYFKRQRECDFVVTLRDEVVSLIQVVYSMFDEETRQREVDGLLEAAQTTGCRNLYILTMGEEEHITVSDYSIRVLPVWQWMLGM
jgi:predicted AAA+ superfamily ATPase